MPTTDKPPLKVFLCHARADRDRVHALREAIRVTMPSLAGGVGEDGLDGLLK